MLVLHIVHTQALMSVWPFLRLADKEIFARYNQYPTRFQTLVKLHCGDRQFIKPQPEEDRPFGFMDAKTRIRNRTLQQLYRMLRFLAIKRLDHLLAKSQQIAFFYHALHQCGSHTAGC
ncbi:Uncharacterised protein [Vibrio cholerae]|nr:Uncharacterised protein [Vibrio cholerae]